MNALVIGLALLVAACGALDARAPAIDDAATRAAQTGGCLKIKCEYMPVRCRPAAARCERGW